MCFWKNIMHHHANQQGNIFQTKTKDIFANIKYINQTGSLVDLKVCFSVSAVSFFKRISRKPQNQLLVDDRNNL